MSETKIRVLKMLEQGKITSAEALELLEALSAEAPAAQAISQKQAEPETAGKKSQSRPLLNELGGELHNLGEEVGAEVRDALREAGNEIKEAFAEVGEELQGIDWSGNISDLLAGLFQGSIGNHYSWTQTEAIAVPDSVKSLDVEITNKNGNVKLVSSPDAREITVQTQFRIKATSEDEARELVEAGFSQTLEQLDDQLCLGWQVADEVSGSIAFTVQIPSNLKVTHNLACKNGSIQLQDIKSCGRVITKNGSITIEGADYGNVIAETKNGKIGVVAGITGLVAETKNGSIRCSLTPIGDSDIALKTKNGSVHAELACGQDFAYQVGARTTHGRLQLSLPDLISKTDEKLYYDGATSNYGTAANQARVSALTKHGSITIGPLD